MKALIAPRAERELAAAVRWIARDNRSAARALRASVFEAAARIGAHPQIGIERPDIAPRRYRFLFLPAVPYVIAYEHEPRPPIIVRILHAARDLPEAFATH